MHTRNIWSVVTLAMAVGCESSGSSHSSTTGAPDTGGECQELDVITQIGQMPGDTETLQAILNNYKGSHPEYCVTHTPISPWQAVDGINQSIAAGARPDVIEIPADQVSAFLETQGPDSLYPLNDFLASESDINAQQDLYPYFLEDATIDGKILGMPFGALCTNGFYYNKIIFAANHLSPPTTIDELRTACETLEAQGITPIQIVGMGGFLQALLPPTMGLDAYYSYMKGGTPDEASLRDAIDLFDELTSNYVDTSISMYDVIGKVTAFIDGQSAMFFAAEWVEATINQLGWTPGVDYGFAFAPGNAGLFSYNLELMSVVSDTPNLKGGLHFLESTISAETQDHVPITHARKYTNKNLLNSERQILIEGMEQANYHLSVNSTNPWETPAYDFIESRDKEALLQVLLSTR